MQWLLDDDGIYVIACTPVNQLIGNNEKNSCDRLELVREPRKKVQSYLQPTAGVLLNILLVQPPITVSKGEIFGVIPPLGLAYLASVAEQDSHHVRILDTIVEGYNFRYLENGFIRIGLENDSIQKEIERSHPDIVGITCPYTLMNKEMRVVASLVKNVHPDVPVVVGGAHPSSMPDSVIQDPNVDFVVAGEGEATFRELITRIEKGASISDLKGVWSKVNGKTILNKPRDPIENLDSLPFPAWHLLSVDKYIRVGQAHGVQKRKRYMPVVTSRGCPMRCIFCSIHSVWGYKWRARSPENVVSEIEELTTRYKIREINFEDDNLTLNKKRMAAICDLIVERNLDISWSTPNGVAIQWLDNELLRKMKRSGCYQLNFGIESGDPYVLRNIIHKPINLDRVRKVVEWSKELGIWTHGFFVIGFPGESPESIRLTITFSKELDLDSANYFIATPYPGTPLYYLALSRGLLKRNLDLTKLRTMDAAADTEYFKAKELVRIQKEAYLEFAKHRLRREILEGDALRRASKARSVDDIMFLMRKVRRLSGILT